MTAYIANNYQLRLTTDLNVEPYYDDYDPDKGYYRILYKPGYAVQARELTQSQTILQSQVNRFARHIFKEGSLVLDQDQNRGRFFLGKIPYVQVSSVDSTNTAIDVSTYNGMIVTGANSAISAKVIRSLPAGSDATVEPDTLYIAYLDSNPDDNVSIFIPGETLVANGMPSLTVLPSANATGYGAEFKINDGVLFAKEHFISFAGQSVIAERYSQNATCQIGFNITESIVDYTDDLTLLDPALGSSNYAAPGADRLKLEPRLVRYNIDEVVDTPDYMQLVVIQNGLILVQNDQTQYSAILDTLASRTYEESGDYLVQGLEVRVRENLDTGRNFGYLDANSGGSANNLTLAISPGVAYVKGYKVNPISDVFLTIPKANTFANVQNQILTTRQGNYFTVDEFIGPWTHDKAVNIYLYDAAQNRISNAVYTGTQTGRQIGKAKLKTVEYRSGTLGTANARVDIYVYDVQMYGSNTVSNVRSLLANDASIVSGADVVLNATGNTTLNDAGLATLLYSTGSNFTKTLRTEQGTIDTTFTFKRTDPDITIGTGGTFSVTITGANEVFPYGSSGSLTTTQLRDFTLVVEASSNIAFSGTVSGTTGTKTLTGSGTNFNLLNVGDKIKFNNVAGPAGLYFVESIGSATSLTLDRNLPATVTANTISKSYIQGDVIDLTLNGATGVARSVTINSPTSLTFDLKESFGTSVPATITYKATRNVAREALKTLKVDRFVKINVAASGTAGPFNLGIPDVLRVKEVRYDTVELTSNTAGSNVTTNFILDNGQRDEYYDYASLYLKPGQTVSSPGWLLVRLDYFEPDYSSGKGYFSVDSYPVNDSNTTSTEIKTEEIPVFKSPATGFIYDLKNHVDFRPVRTMAAADSITVAGASTNPSNNAIANARTYQFDSIGFRLPAVSEQFIFDYSYYLPRRDLVVVNKDGTFSVKQGLPATTPRTPVAEDIFMPLATVYITPYPSLGTNYAQLIDRNDLASVAKKTVSRRYTMRDIGTLKQRIENLEYYASLSLLEKNALDFQVLDANKENRFKNGIFVDTFTDHSLGRQFNNPDYRISINSTEKSIVPLYNQESLYYDVITGSNNNIRIFNLEDGTSVATLNYTEEPFITQNVATTERNIETSVYQFNGTMTLIPPTDVYTESVQLPDNVVESENSITLNYDSWTTIVTGYQIVDAATGAVLRKYSASDTFVVNYGGLNATTNLKWYAYNVMGIVDGSTVSAKDYAILESRLLAGPYGVKEVSWYNGPNISTRVEEITATSRAGSEGFSGQSEDQVSLGNSVVNAQLETYIRPQVINISAQGLKANTKFYTFFAGEAMSKYTTPTDASFNPIASEGSEVRSDYNGNVRCLLRIPPHDEKRFTVGNKEVVLTDSRTNEDSATSAAWTSFLAQGLIQSLQETILTTRTIITIPAVPAGATEYGTETVHTEAWRYWSCMAYSFFVQAPLGEEGLYLSSVDVFFSQKDSQRGVWFEVREMNSAGGITRNQVPFSYKRFTSAQIPTSNDASVPLNVKFDAPIFLQNNRQYALVIHTEGINPNTYMYVAIKGQNSIVPAGSNQTSVAYTSRPQTGTLYTTNNDLNYIPVDGTDLKVKFYRAKFNTAGGSLIMGNQSLESFKANTLSSVPLSRIGEKYVGTDRLIISSTTGGTLTTNMNLVGNTSAANIAISSISGTTYFMANSGFTSGEGFYARYTANGANAGITGTISSLTRASGNLYRYQDSRGQYYIDLKNSSGDLLVGDTMRGVQSGQSFRIESFRSRRYSLVDFEPSALNFTNTTINYEMRTIANNGSSVSDISSFIPINDKINTEFDTEKALYSKTIEKSLFANNHSNAIRVTMRTTSDYISPLLDLGRSHSIYVNNLINELADGDTSENLATGGNLFNKYISKVVTLAEDQDAEDLNVILTAYRPPGTNVRVWVKILHAEDPELFDSKPWILMDYIDKSTVYSSISDKSNFIEYGFKFPDAQLTGIGSTGEQAAIEYTNSAGQKFTGFKHFSVKIGLSSTNSAIVPRVADLRCLALQL